RHCAAGPGRGRRDRRLARRRAAPLHHRADGAGMTFGEASGAPGTIAPGAPIPILVAAASPALRAGLAALLARDPGLQPIVASPAARPTPLESTEPTAAASPKGRSPISPPTPTDRR